MGLTVLSVRWLLLNRNSTFKETGIPDKPGDTFQDKQGKDYVLGKDPKDGHLRPYAKGKQPKGCTSVIAWTVSRVVAAL